MPEESLFGEHGTTRGNKHVFPIEHVVLNGKFQEGNGVQTLVYHGKLRGPPQMPPKKP